MSNLLCRSSCGARRFLLSHPGVSPALALLPLRSCNGEAALSPLSSSVFPAFVSVAPSLDSKWLHSTAMRGFAMASKLKEIDTADDIDPTKPADYNPASYDPTESRSAPSEKILRLVDEIANLSLIEASDLNYVLQKKLGLPDSAMPYYGGGMGGMAMNQAAGAGPAAEEEKKPEKTTFDVKLEKFDAASKIKIIKEVRAFTSLGLKEAKELVEKLPAILKRGVSKEEADQMVEKLKAVGATAALE